METIKSLNGLLAFVKVSEFRSFSVAARELNVSKAYLSKLIQNHENEVGQKLLHRTTRMVKLTLEGEKYFEVCAQAIAKISAAHQDLKATSETPRGLLRITTAGAFAEEVIAPLAAKLAKQYPALTIEISFNERIVDLVAENFDLGIRVGQLEDSTLIAKRISTRREHLCATPEYLAARGIPKTPADLRDHNCLKGASQEWWFSHKDGQNSQAVKGNFISNNARALLKATLAGVGICRLPTIYVKPYLERGELVPLLESYVPQEIPIWAIYPSKKNQSYNARLFLQELSSH